MPSYTVKLTRTIKSEAIVTVEAPSADEARNVAMAQNIIPYRTLDTHVGIYEEPALAVPAAPVAPKK